MDVQNLYYETRENRERVRLRTKVFREFRGGVNCREWFQALVPFLVPTLAQALVLFPDPRPAHEWVPVPVLVTSAGDQAEASGEID